MTPQEFAGKIKSKYPQYASIDDADLSRKMVAKYPQYASQVDFGPSKLQQGAQLATLPFRGYRGLAVGAENLIAHPTEPAAALQRASEATQTGFQPKGIMESGASILGESVPMLPLGGEMAAGGKFAQLIKAAMASGGLSAVNQTAEEGSPTIGRTATAAALGAAPIAAVQGAQKVFPAVAGKFTKVPAEAYRNLTSAFKKTFTGTPEAIETQASRVSPTLEAAKDAVSKRINSRRAFMGMDMSPKEALAEMESTGGEPRSFGRIAKEFKGIQKESAPFRQVTEESKLLGPRGEPLRKTTTVRGIPKGEKLRRLEDFTKDINKTTGGSYTTDVLQSKRAIEQAATKTGGTSYKLLTKFKQQWGNLKGIEEQMGTNLSDPNTAGKDLENIVRKTLEKPDKMTSTDLNKLDAVEKLEKATGKQIIEPLRNQIKSSYTNQDLSDFVPKGMLGKVLLMKYFPEGLASFIMGSPKAMGGVAQILNNPAGPIAKGARAAAPSLISEALKRNRENSNP